MAYYLRDEGYPFKKIYHGKKWVGRVCKHADGGYLGIIGKMSIRADSETVAFEEIAARAMGYPNAATLKAKNRAVRSHNYQRSKAARQAAREFMAADLQGRIEIIDHWFDVLEGKK